MKLAVKRILDSKTFDNGTICASEQSVVCDEEMRAEVQAEMERQGAYFLTPEQIKKLGSFILRANGTMNPMIVGKSARVIADLAGIEVPEGTRVLVAEETGIGRGHPYSNEKLAPILAFYTAPSYVEICELCTEILHYEGAGHTFSMHTKDENMVTYFAQRIPASRIIVNTPSASWRNRRNYGAAAGSDIGLRRSWRKRNLRKRRAKAFNEPALCGRRAFRIGGY